MSCLYSGMNCLWGIPEAWIKTNPAGGGVLCYPARAEIKKALTRAIANVPELLSVISRPVQSPRII